MLIPGRLFSAFKSRIHLLAINSKLRRERIYWLRDLTGSDETSINSTVDEIEKDKEFLRAVRRLYRKHTKGYIPSPFDFMAEEGGNSMFFPCVSMYVLVRLIKPEVIVETGGTPGKSSAFILRALQLNKKGKLYTIDLPPEPSRQNKIKVSLSHSTLPRETSSGWCIPDFLKSRHHLLLGKSEERLPPLLEELDNIDIFIHDSLHTYEHMTWEFETSWPHISRGGFLCSDDIDSNLAWHDFCETHSLQPRECLKLGVIRKE